MVTAFGREEVLRDARHAGLQDVLVKPVSLTLLREMTLSALAQEEAAGTLEVRTADAQQRQLAELRSIAGARVLVVEDNDINQEVAREMLLEAGLVVDIAENGEVALDCVGRDEYDLVLMDMQMPVMDGLTATRRMRQIDRLAKVPILAMTANAMEQDRHRCLESGMNDTLVKPIEPAELWKALLQWIPKAGAGRVIVPPCSTACSSPPPHSPAHAG
jgi:two-component system sensor histidine kinase/response regulator